MVIKRLEKWCQSCRTHPLDLCQPCWEQQERVERLRNLEWVLRMTQATVYRLAKRGDYRGLASWKQLERTWTQWTTQTPTISVLKPWT